MKLDGIVIIPTNLSMLPQLGDQDYHHHIYIQKKKMYVAGMIVNKTCEHTKMNNPMAMRLTAYAAMRDQERYVASHLFVSKQKRKAKHTV